MKHTKAITYVLKPQQDFPDINNRQEVLAEKVVKFKEKLFSILGKRVYINHNNRLLYLANFSGVELDRIYFDGNIEDFKKLIEQDFKIIDMD